MTTSLPHPAGIIPAGLLYNIPMTLTTLRYGNTNTFLLRGTGGSLLVDTDFAGTMPMFYKAVKACGVKVSDITYVMATHYHPDHMGLVSCLVEQGVKLVVMESQVPYVGYSDAIFSRAGLSVAPISVSSAITLSFDESRSFLSSLGIAGEIISTPSHSPDSVSVMLDSGEAIVGDLEPYSYLAGYSSNTALASDWSRVLSYSPSVIYHAHANAVRMAGGGNEG